MWLSQNRILDLEKLGFIVTAEGVLTEYQGQGGDVVIPDGVISVGDGAFYERVSLTSVELLDGIVSIADDAFCCCASLVSVVIPASVTSMGRSVFAECASLASVNIPVSVTSVNWGMFYGCTSLALVVIPGKVLSIADWAFYGCNSLASIVIPGSVQSIGSEAFKGCAQLKKVLCPSYQYDLLGQSGFDVRVVTRLDIKQMTLCLPEGTGSSERWQEKYPWDPRSFLAGDHSGRTILCAMIPDCHRIMFMRMPYAVMLVVARLLQPNVPMCELQQVQQESVAHKGPILPNLPNELWLHIMSFVGWSAVKPTSFVPLVRALCRTEPGEKTQSAASGGSAGGAAAPAAPATRLSG